MELEGMQEVTAIRASHIKEHYSHLQVRPNKNKLGTLRTATVHQHMHSVELFFTVLQSKGEIPVHPYSGIQGTCKAEQPAERAVLTQGEIKVLYKCCETLQERTILALAYGCGLRVSELVQCNTDDVKLKEGILIVPRGKGNKRRVIPLSRGVVKDLSAYFYQMRIFEESKDYKSFMLNSRGNRMQENTYNKHLKNMIERTNNKSIAGKRISMHSLRHSIATHLIEEQMPLEQVRLFLGHSQIETTEVYTHISEKQLKEMIHGNTEKLS